MFLLFFFVFFSAGADFPFNEERVIPDGVNRNSAIIGGGFNSVSNVQFCLVTEQQYHLIRCPMLTNDLVPSSPPPACAGVIAVVIFTILCTLVFLIRYMFRHKGTYHTNEAKGAETADNADAAIIGHDPTFTETIDESKKEWFI